jgi:RNA polymerase sigma-70 factor (ECF subfamily)
VTLRALFEQCYAPLVRVLSARYGDADAAEDHAQEAFVRLVDAAPRDPRRWVAAVAQNLARDEARLTRGRARRLLLLDGAATAPGADARLEREEEGAAARRALARLSPRDRELLLLHHDGVRYRDIAARLGVAPSSVGPLLARAHRRFVRAFGMTGGDHESVASRGR